MAIHACCDQFTLMHAHKLQTLMSVVTVMVDVLRPVTTLLVATIVHAPQAACWTPTVMLVMVSCIKLCAQLLYICHLQTSMSVLLALTTVLKTVTIMETVEGSLVPVTLDTHWTLMDALALVSKYCCIQLFQRLVV